MFNLFKKKLQGTEVKLKIEGMHCTSCAMNIDGALEDTAGVFRAETSYAKAEVSVDYNPDTLTEDEIKNVIIQQGYEIASDDKVVEKSALI